MDFLELPVAGIFISFNGICEVREVKQALTHVQDGAVVFEEGKAEYWACQSFGNSECFFNVPIPYFELEDDLFFGWCFDVAICNLKFERGWFQFFDYVFEGPLKGFVVVCFGYTVDKGTRINGGVQG